MTEAVGSLAEEAAKLFGVAEEWWRAHAPAAVAQAGHTGPECRVCPFCQALSVVRNAQPEVFEHLVTAADAFAAAVRAAVEAYVSPRRADVPVERIDIT
ncbi:MAG TPA: hypothetical protein VGX28_01210 [Frankiaceae bacterium]|nr:hypothetical protein [Frankiaceae bacterium]